MSITITEVLIIIKGKNVSTLAVTGEEWGDE